MALYYRVQMRIRKTIKKNRKNLPKTHKNGHVRRQKGGDVPQDFINQLHNEDREFFITKYNRVKTDVENLNKKNDGFRYYLYCILDNPTPPEESYFGSIRKGFSKLFSSSRTEVVEPVVVRDEYDNIEKIDTDKNFELIQVFSRNKKDIDYFKIIKTKKEPEEIFIK
jgi:hypothetical protein